MTCSSEKCVRRRPPCSTRCGCQRCKRTPLLREGGKFQPRRAGQRALLSAAGKKATQNNKTEPSAAERVRESPAGLGTVDLLSVSGRRTPRGRGPKGRPRRRQKPFEQKTPSSTHPRAASAARSFPDTSCRNLTPAGRGPADARTPLAIRVASTSRSQNVEQNEAQEARGALAATSALARPPLSC